MNKIFRVIWNHATQSWVAVSELTKAHKKAGKAKKIVINSLVVASVVASGHVMAATALSGETVNPNKAVANGGTAIGDGAVARGGDGGVSIGRNAGINTDIKAVQNIITIGQHSRAGWDGKANVSSSPGRNNELNRGVGQAIAIGGGNQPNEGAWAEGDQSISIGSNTHARGDSSIAIGGDDVDKVASKQITYTNVDGKQKTGTINQAMSDLAKVSMQPGTYTNTTADGAAVAIGIKTTAADLSLALGSLAQAQKVNTVAIGSGAIAALDNSVAIGGGARADNDSAGTVQKGTTIGSLNYTFSGGENTLPGDIVSFGAKGYERQLKNIAAGEISTTSRDAINGSQLFGILNTLVSHNFLQYAGDDAQAGKTDATKKIVKQSLDNNRLNILGGATTLSDNNIGVVYDAGNNIDANGKDIAPSDAAYQQGALKVKLAKELKDLTSAEFKNTAGDATTINGNGVSITPNGQTNPAISLTKDGLSNGGKKITNVDGNLPVTQNSDVANSTAQNSNATKSQAAPTNVTNTNAATVGDVLNAGWNLQGNGNAVDFVKPYDTVNFANGEGTTVSVESADGKTSTVKVNINKTTFSTSTTADNTIGDIVAGNAGDYFPTAASVAKAINDTRIRYFSVNSTEQGNRDNKGATGTDAIAVGPNATATASNSTAMGKGATAKGDDSVALGSGAVAEVAQNEGSVAIGKSAKAGNTAVGTENAATAIGNAANASADGGTAVGNGAKAFVSNSTAIGIGAVAGSKTKADGSDTNNKDIAYGLGAVAIGNNSIAAHAGSIALGTAASGKKVAAYGKFTTAIGAGAQVGSEGNAPDGASQWSAAMGYLAKVGNSQVATAIGPMATIGDGATYGLALGGLARINNNARGSVAIGERSAVAEGVQHGVALGSRSQATIGTREGFNPATQKAGLTGVNKAVADARANTYAGLANEALTSTLAAVSIGGTFEGKNNTRQINHLAAGTADTDAVNVAQLRSVNLKIAGNTNGQTASALKDGTSEADKAKADVLLDSQTLKVVSADQTYLTTDATNNTITITPKTAKIGKTDNGATTYVGKDGKVNVPTTDGLATAQDVANAINASGWKVGDKDKSLVDTINSGDQVNFINGNATTATVAKDGTTGNVDVKYDVTTGNGLEVNNGAVVAKAGNGITVNADGINVNAGDGLEIDGTSKKVKAKAADNTISVGSDGIKVNTSQNAVNDTTNDGKLKAPDNNTGTIATIDNVINAVNNAAWKVQGEIEGTGAADTGHNSVATKVTAGDTVKLKAGDNLKIKQAEKDFTFSLNPVLSGLTSAEFKTTGTNPVTSKIDGNGITITPSETGKSAVSLTNNGLDNGNNVISNVAAGTKDSDAVNLSQLKNAGWKVGNNGKAEVDTINSGEQVNFTNGNGTTVTVEKDMKDGVATGNVNIKYDVTAVDNSVDVGANGIKVKTSDGIETTTTGIKAKAGNGITVDSNGINVKPADSTISVGNEGIKVNTAKNAESNTTGTVKVATGEAGKIATIDSVVDAVNKAAWVAKATGNGTNGTDDNVSAGTVVTFDAGTNIVIDHSTANKFTFKTSDNPIFTDVQFGNNGPKISADGNNIKVGDKDGKPVKITNVADGEISSTSKDAINGSQFNTVANNTIKLQGQNGDEAVTSTNTQNLNKTGGIAFTVKSADKGLLTVAASGDAITLTPVTASIGAKGADNKVTYVDADGKVNVPTTDGLATATDVANAINSAAWKAAASGNGVTNDTADNVTAGSTVTFDAGKNIVIDHSTPNKFSFKTSDTPTFISVQVGGDTGPKISADGDNFKVTKADGTSPTKITNVATGTEDNDAVNVAQLKAVAEQSWKIEGSAVDGGTYNSTTAAEQTVSKDQKVGLKAGKNIVLDQKDRDFTYSLSKTLSDLTSAEFKDANNNTVNITPTGVTITKPAATTGGTPTTVTLNQNGLDNGGNAITNVAGNLPETRNVADAQDATNKPKTDAQAAPTNVQTNNAATVGDILNAGWNIQEKGTAKDFVKAYDTVNFADGTGTTASVEVSKDGTTSTVKYNVNAGNGLEVGTDNKVTAKAGNGVTVDGTGINVNTGKGLKIDAADSNKVAVDTDGTTIEVGTDGKVKAVTGTTEVVTAENKTGNEKVGQVKPSTGSKDKLATVESVANAVNSAKWYALAKNDDTALAAGDETADTSATAQAMGAGDELTLTAGKNLRVKRTGANFTFATVENPEFKELSLKDGNNQVKVAPTDKGLSLSKGDKDNSPVNITGVTSGLDNHTSGSVNGLRDLNKTTEGTNTPVVSDNTAATVGDLRNMGWVVSAEKTTSGTSAYSEAVKNANEVKFVGTGLATVSGKTDGGVRTITVDVNAQNTTNSSVTPVEYTKADGTKVYPQTVTNQDGTTTVKFFPNPDGTGEEVPANQVITSVNGPEGTTKPTTLANVEGNLEGAKTNTTAPTTSATAPTIGSAAGNVNKNNAATVGDVLNVGWNLQGNGSAVDFVKAYDTVNFVDGKGTKAVVSTDDNLVSRVTFNIDAGEITADKGADNNPTGKVSGPTTAENAKTLTENLAKAQKALADLAEDATAEARKEALENVAKAEKAIENAGLNKVATSQNVAEAINNSFWTATSAATANGEVSGTSNEQVNPGDKVTFEADKNIKITQNAGKFTFATKEDVSFNTVNLGNPETYTNAAGDEIVKTKDGKFYKKADLNAAGEPNAGAQEVAESDVITVNPVNMKTTAAKPASNNVNADGSSNQPTTALDISSGNKPTQLTGVGSVLNTKPVETTPTGGTTKTSTNLIDLVGDTTNPVNKNAAATVGDLQNMGWVVSSDKTTGATGEYKDVVKNANEVKFVGTGLATVSGKTDGNVRTVTVDVDAQKVVEAAQTPVVYTDNNGNKLTKIGDNFYKQDDVKDAVIIDGKPYPAGTKTDSNGKPVQSDGTTAATAIDAVKSGDITASMNNGSNETGDPAMKLSNVGSNLPTSKTENGNVVNAKDSAPITATEAANLLQPYELDENGAVKNDAKGNPIRNTNYAGNNAATVSDVLNAGWNLQGNGSAVDFVKAYDTVNFVNGGNTTVSVTTDDNLTSKVQVNVTGLPIANTVTVNGKEVPLVKVGDNYYPAKADGSPDTAAAPYRVINGKVYSPDAVDSSTDTAGNTTYTPKAGANPTTVNTNLVNPNAPQGSDQVSTPTQLGNVANGATTFAAPKVDSNDLKMANDGKWYPASQVNPNGTTAEGATSVEKPLTQENATAGLVDFKNSNPNNAATVGDLQNMGWVVSTQDGNGYADQVRNANKVDFKGEGLATIKGETLADGTRQITVSVKTGEVVKSNEFTTPEGNKLVKVGNDYYNQADIDPTTGEPKANTNPAYKTVGGKVYAANQVKDDGSVEADALVANVTNSGAGLVTGNQVADAIQNSSWTVGKATQALADDKFQNEDEKVNPNDTVRFADGKGVTVKTATVESTNADGSKETTTVVKFDTDLPLDYNKVTDADGNELKQANDGKWYKADDVADNGTLKPATDGTLPKEVAAKDIKKEGAILSDSNSSSGNNPYQTAIEKAAIDKIIKENPKATPEEILAKVAEEVAKQEASEKAGAGKDEIKAGKSGVQLNNVGWAENPDQAVNKDQLDQTVAKSGFFVQQNGKSTMAANAGETDVAKTEKVTPNDVVDFVDGKGTKVKAETTRDANGVDTTKVSVDVDAGEITANDNGSVTGPVPKALQDKLVEAKKELAGLPKDATEEAKKAAADKVAEAQKAINDAPESNKVATAQNVADMINNSGFTLKTSEDGGKKVSGDDEAINPGDVIDMAAGKNLTVKQDANGKVTYATADDVAFNTIKVGEPETYKDDQGNTVVKVGDKFYKEGDVENGAPKEGVNEVAADKVTTTNNPQVNFARQDATKATNNGTDDKDQPSSALNISSTDGKPTQLTGVGSTLNVKEVDTAPNGSTGTNKPKANLVDLEGDAKNPVNKNAAATVGDLQNMGWVVGADGNSYVDTVKNANKVEFKGGNGIEVTGETTKDGVREITVAIKEGKVTNEVTITKEGSDKPITAIKDGDKYYEKGADGKADTTKPIDVTNKDKVENAGSGFVTGNTVATAINESGWNVGLADQAKADEAFGDETKALSADKLEKVNPDDNVRFANGKNTTVKAATVDEVNADGKKVTNTYVKVDVELPIGQITAVDAKGNKVVKDADGNWYPAKADGSADKSKDAIDPTTVRQSATMDPDKKGDQYSSISDRTSDAALTQTQKDAIAKVEKEAADKVAEQLKDQPASVVKAAQDAAKAEAKDKYLADNKLDKGTGGTVITNVAWGTQPNDAVNVDQLQNSGWNLDSKAVKDSTGKVITGNTSATKVKMDETVNIDAGNNIEITRNGRDIEIATSMDPKFNTVKIGDVTLQPNTDSDGNSALALLGNITNDNPTGATKITNLADGDISPTSTDAVNGSQIYALTRGDIPKTQDITVKNPDGTETTYKNVVVGPDGKTPMLTTYNVYGQTEVITNSVVTAVHRMNEQGIKFFHTNDGVAKPITEDRNTIDSSAAGSYATAIGYQAKANGTNAVAMGNGSQALGDNTIAIGTGNIVTANNSGAFGDPNYIDGKVVDGEVTTSGSYAVGNNNVINSSNTFVLGNNVNNSNTKDANGRPQSVGDTVANSVYLGNNTTATAGEGVGTVNFSIKDGKKVEGNTTTAGDKGKVETATVGNMTYGGFAGATANGVVSVGASNGNERRIQNVAAGEISRTSTDAINGSQLYSVAKGLGDQINNVAGQVNKLGKRMEAGIAGAMAAANLMQPHRSGQSAAMAAIGQHKNQAALAVGYSRISDNGKYGIKLSLGADTQGQVSTGAGVSYFW